MNTKNFTEKELTTLVENFAKQMRTHIESDMEGTAMVLSVITPSEEEGKHHAITAEIGKGINLIHCVHGLDEGDESLIKRYLKHIADMMLAEIKRDARKLLSILEDKDDNEPETTTTDADQTTTEGE